MSGHPPPPSPGPATGARHPARRAWPKPAPQARRPHITEILAENPHAWGDSLKIKLARCATLSFFERPDCAWAARKQYRGPNQGWGAVKECLAPP